jgi:hypothetical protein
MELVIHIVREANFHLRAASKSDTSPGGYNEKDYSFCDGNIMPVILGFGVCPERGICGKLRNSGRW